MTGLSRPIARAIIIGIALLAGAPLGLATVAPIAPGALVRVIRVPAGGNLQSAIDAASPGDRLELARGGVYEGPFTLRRKNGNDWIVITSAGTTSSLTRARPESTSSMARLIARSGAVVTAEAGAHHYRLEQLAIMPAAGAALTALVQLGDAVRRSGDLPRHIVLDGCVLRGDPTGTRRGVALNAADASIVNSHLSGFKEAGADSQAVAVWNGTGPFTLDNNYLEAAGENVMFGGADPLVPGLVPADIRITGNHFSKPLAWRRGTPRSDGTAWTVKNLLELKNARRALITRNVFEHSWADAQAGFAILFTPRNQDGGAPWSVVEDVVFSGNVVRHSGGGINILGRDDSHPSQVTQRITIRGNLFSDIGDPWGAGRLFQLLDGTRNVEIVDNTAFQTGPAVLVDEAPHHAFVFRGNLVRHNDYGMIGSGTSSGRATLDRYLPDAVVDGNVFIGGRAGDYPPGNRFVATRAEAERLRVGADVALLARMADQVVTPSASAPRAAGLDQFEPPAGSAGRARSATSAAVAFWVALALLAYVYVGYPAVMWARARVRPCRPIRGQFEPTVTIVVAAHNEGDRIATRIENLLELDYPGRCRDIIVGSDGSTDDTVFRASGYSRRGVRVEAFAEWRGKAAVLNDLVASSSADVVVFADARQRFDRGVLRALASHFVDPTVGAVSGELMLVSDGGASIGQGACFYWRYEKFIRRQESLCGSTVGVTGAIYAVRRAAYEPIPADTILDDVLVPMRIVRQGYTVRFEPEARAYDRVSTTASEEYARKVRTISGMFQLFVQEPWLLNPLRNPLWFETISHKGLRLLLPLLHVAVLAMPLALLRHGWIYQAALAAQLAFYGAALGGHALRHWPKRPRWFAVPYAMCVLIWATGAGFARFMDHREPTRWERATPMGPMTSSPPARGRGV